MGRPRSGSLEPAGRWTDGSLRFRARLRLGDGTKSDRIDLDVHFADADDAREYVRAMQAQEDRDHALLDAKRAKVRARAEAAHTPHDGETANAWHVRFLASRDGRVGDVKHARGLWRKWVAQHIGERPMAAVTRDEIEAVRDALDEAIAAFVQHGRARKRDERRLMPKSASNVWAVVTTAFKFACTAKRATGLRVRDDNPCANVQPPEKGDSRRKTWIYPSEFLELVSCAPVPREWRELYAIACYLYLRPGELFELRWRDVDLDSEVVSVTRAWDWEDRATKAPKTANGVREVPIPMALLPLLSRMRRGQALDAKVVPIMERTGENKGARLLRVHLGLAGVTHPRLTEDTATRMPVGFRSWRDTGITWAAIDGVDVAKLQRRAGHDDIATTLAYVKEAEDRGKLRGRVFPALPLELIAGEAFGPAIGPAEGRSGRKNRSASVPEEGVEHQDACEVDTRSHTSEREPPSEPADRSRYPDPNGAIGPAIGPTERPPATADDGAGDVIAKLATALEHASAAGQWDVVALLARELEARRLAAAGNVVQMPRPASRKDRR